MNIKEPQFSSKEALPTQKFVEVESVKDGVVILKNGGLRQILIVSGLNFDLKSEEEQNMIVALFQNFLNSLSFSVQIFVHSRKVNIESYLENLSLREAQEGNELLKNQISEYIEFIRAFVSENAIMNKSYFIVVPYEPLKLGGGSEAVTKKLFGLLGKKGVQKPTERIAEQNLGPQKQLEHHTEQLTQRVNQVIAGLNQVDLRAVPLNDDEIIELFYNLYNPEAVEKKGLQIQKNQ